MAKTTPAEVTYDELMILELIRHIPYGEVRVIKQGGKITNYYDTNSHQSEPDYEFPEVDNQPLQASQ